MKGINSRPLLGYSLVIIIIMFSLGVILVQSTRNYVVHTVEERLINEGTYISSYIETRSFEKDSVPDELKKISEQLGIGIAYINQYGELNYYTIHALDLETEKREQVQLYLHKYKEKNISNSKGELVDTLFFYPVPLNDVENHTLLLILEVGLLEDVTRNIWIITAITLSLGIVAIVYIGYGIVGKYIKPMQSVTELADELSKGNYSVRTYEDYYGESGVLTGAVNKLARNLQQMSIQQERLKTVIDNMGSGLLLIDEKGYIQLVNRAFLEVFSGEIKDYVGYLYYEAISYPDIHQTVQEVFMLDQKVIKSMILPLTIQRKFLEITGVPIMNNKMVPKGAVLVFHDITELKMLEKTRKDFVANVSHELKTPITSIRGFAETLLEGNSIDPPTSQQFLSIILKESERLQSLIQDLLELSKIEKDGFKLEKYEFFLSDLVEEVWPILLSQAEQKGINLTKKVDHILVDGDPNRIKQIIVNLIVNAVNYTGQNGQIELIGREEDEWISLVVKDNGIGIPEQELPRIFERFYRVDKARSRNSGGTGLGLAIVKHIVEAHKGKINVQSEVGTGTTFSIYLPRNIKE
ncbi:ATP-binding protein [Bacillaceae bacterium S4-13-56]